MTDKDEKTYYKSKKCYFTFAYFDINYDYPVIETYIYLGNASELKDKIPTKEGFLYFQDAESYVHHGFLNSKRHKLESGEVRIWQISEAEVKESLLDYDGLIQELKKCNK